MDKTEALVRIFEALERRSAEDGMLYNAQMTLKIYYLMMEISNATDTE
jgi:type IV secretory pathway component VirB8